MTALSDDAEPAFPLPSEREYACRPAMAAHGCLTGESSMRTVAEREHCGLHERPNCYRFDAVDEVDAEELRMKNAAVYARTAQACPASLQHQFERCSHAAQRLGLRVAAQSQFQDDGVSGRCVPRERPGYRRLEDLLALGDCYFVLVDNASRLSRSSTHLGVLLETFRRRGIRVFEAETGSELSLLTLWGKAPAFSACAIPPKDADSRR